MNRKLFHRQTLERQLVQLYREADRGVPVRSVEPHLRDALVRIQELRRCLIGLAREVEPSNSSAGQAALLAAVTRRKSELEEKEQPLLGRLIGSRGLALLAVAGIFAGGAATVSASGGVLGVAGHANSVLSALHITHKSQSSAENTTSDAATQTPAAEGTRRAVEGIPTGNPQHPPATGTCEKGEAIVKTVPSGVAVNVPCQTVKDHGQGSATAEADRTPDADGTPGAQATDHAGDGDQTPVRIPTQANPHATEGAGDGLH